MSLTIAAYLVDTPSIREVFGSRDERTIDALKVALAQDGKWNSDPVAHALKDIVNGATLDPENADDYAAALEILCMRFGSELPHEAFESLHGPALSLLRQFEGLYSDTDLPLPIPPSNDFPTIYYISSEQAKANQTSLDCVVLDIENSEGRAWAADAMQQYRLWLQEAVAQGKDLFLFMY